MAAAENDTGQSLVFPMKCEQKKAQKKLVNSKIVYI
jgi:hypothetical protein